MVGVGVFGSGYWGPNLIRNLNEMKNVSLEVVCDLMPERLAYVQAKFPNISSVTSDQQAVLQNDAVDAVVIATPAETHYELTKAAIEAGKHVLVEKPLALHATEAEHLVSLAQTHNRILMVGHTFLYNAAVHMLKQHITEGKLGDVYYIYAQRLNLGRIRQDLNAMWNFAPHDISILLYLLDSAPYRVSARGFSYLQHDIDDVAYILLDFPGNISAHIHISWLDPQKVRRMTVVGSEKMAIYDDTSPDAKIQLYDKGVDKIPSVHTERDFESFAEFQLLLRSGDVHIPAVKFTEPLQAECAHFIECIMEGKQPRSDGQSGLQVVKVLEAAQRSLQHGGRLEELV